jgi:hypothetical protein
LATKAVGSDERSPTEQATCSREVLADDVADEVQAVSEVARRRGYGRGRPDWVSTFMEGGAGRGKNLTEVGEEHTDSAVDSLVESSQTTTSRLALLEGVDLSWAGRQRWRREEPVGEDWDDCIVGGRGDEVRRAR